MIEPRFIEAFHAMWGTFPGPVLLIHRDRTVLAVNDAARSVGVPTGIKCFSLNPEEGHEHCRHCRANQALKTGQAIATKGNSQGKETIGYWLPIRDCPDAYVHLGVTPAEIPAESPVAQLVSL